MKQAFTIFATAILLIAIAGFVRGTDIGQAIQSNMVKTIIQAGSQAPQAGVSSARANYSGRLRIYVVEPTSRWTDYNGTDYHYAFLDFALDSVLSIPYQSQITVSATWNGTAAGFGDIKDTNIAVIAAVFDPIANQGYADPPSGNPFTAYYVDASALAKPGIPGNNIKTTDYTHTVFVEEATAQWCPNCPPIKTALSTLYNFGIYNFCYAAMVGEDYTRGEVLNLKAEHRVRNDLNLAGWPTSFGDGGSQVAVGSYGSPAENMPYLTSMIQAAGAMDVHDLDLNVTLDTVGAAQLQIQVTITNNEYINAPPAVAAAPSGPVEGANTKQYTFTAATTDPEGQQVFYQFDWGNSTLSSWYGPYASGATATANHAWSDTGTYLVKVRAKDDSNVVCDWSAATSVSLAKIGDANGDYKINVGDAVYLINYIFKGGPHPMPYNDCGDANCDNKVNVGDAVYMINYVFKGGQAPGCH